MRKLKIGDTVRLKNKRGYHWNSEGKMDKFLGKVVRIGKLDLHGLDNYSSIQTFNIVEEPKWCFDSSDVVEIIEDTKKSLVPGLRNEHKKLTFKVDRLKGFMESDKYDVLTEEQKDLLQFQYAGMVIYQKALRMRIDNLENKKEPTK